MRMAFFEIGWRNSALKELRRLQKQDAAKIVAAVEALADQPFPASAKKLVGAEITWRVRVGDYRVIYDVETGIRVIMVVKVGHRRDVYR